MVIVKEDRKKRVEYEVVCHRRFLSFVYSRIAQRWNTISNLTNQESRGLGEYNARMFCGDIILESKQGWKMIRTALNGSLFFAPQLVPAMTIDDSQCDTIYDEEMTEEDEDEEEEEEEEDDEDEEDETIAEASSSCTQSSENTNEEISLSNLSPEIQNFIHQFPDFCKHFQIISKIGEGTSLY
jgi:hypothetical protein